MKIGSPEDGDVKGMLPLGKSMYIIKERAIYSVLLADAIDPGRTNPDIPHTQQRVLGYGSESQLVGRTLLTAKELFNESFLPKSFDRERALIVVLEALKDLADMMEMASEYRAAEQAAIDRFSGQQHTQGSLEVPAITGVPGRCKAFIQKADRVCSALYRLAELFYGCKIKHCDALADLCRGKYGSQDPFAQFISGILEHLRFVRDARNSFEHEKPNQKCTVTDFSLGARGKIDRPTMSVTYQERTYPVESVSAVMSQLSELLSEIFERTMAHLCQKHVQSFGGIPIEVVEWPEDQRREKHVRFSYGGRLGGQLAPIS